MSVTTRIDTLLQLQLMPRGALLGRAMRPPGSTGPTRDPDFDHAYLLSGSRPELLAVLFGSRPELRATPMRLGALYVEAYSREITVTLPERRGGTGAVERVLIEYALTLARALEDGEHLLEGVNVASVGAALTAAHHEGVVGALSAANSAPKGALTQGEHDQGE